MRNSIEFKVWGRYALFTDPITKIGGEKCSYQIPTYEAIKGIVKSIYWKPSLIWVIDKVRVMKSIKTQTKGMKPLKFNKKGNDLSIYTFLMEVEYQVQAHFVWNPYRTELFQDHNEDKHYQIIRRMLAKGGRQDIFLGTRDCQGYVEPCQFGEGKTPYDELNELSFGLMFHGFDYPDEIGNNELHSRFWFASMQKGVIQFPTPENCTIKKFIKKMTPKIFIQNRNFSGIEEIAI